MKLKRLILLGLGILTLASCTTQENLEYQGAGAIPAPFVSTEPTTSQLEVKDEPTEPTTSQPTSSSEVEESKPVVSTKSIFNDSISEVSFTTYECEGFYDLQILNQDYSLVYQCSVPYGGDMVTIEDSWKQLPHYSKSEFYSDGIHPGGTYKFDYYKFPIENEYVVLKVRGSTDETHSWNLKYVSSIEFLSGKSVSLESAYLDYNGEYSNCIDYQCLNGNQIEGGSNKVIETDYGKCETFKIIIDGWVK